MQEIEQNLSISAIAIEMNKRRLQQKRYREELEEEREMLRAEEEFEIHKAYGVENDTDYSDDNPWK